jgi:hypothetical protein
MDNYTREVKKCLNIGGEPKVYEGEEKIRHDRYSQEIEFLLKAFLYDEIDIDEFMKLSEESYDRNKLTGI